MEPLAPFLVKLFLAITAILGGGPWTLEVPPAYLVDDSELAKYTPAVCGKYQPVAYFAGGRILISNRLKPFENAQDASILVHELTHYIQSKRAPHKLRTLMGDEREAYYVQGRFLKLLGEQPGFKEDWLKCEGSNHAAEKVNE